MPPITYEVRLAHKERGVGFTAKQAIDAQVRQPHSPVTAVRLGEHSSDKSTLYVTFQEDVNEAMVRGILDKSGRIHPGSLKIEEVQLVIPEDHPALKALEQEMRQRYRGSISALETDKRELQEKAAQASAKTVNSPLEGLLLYFEKIHPGYSLSTTIEEEKDMRFVREVLAGEKTNTFLDYHNFQHAEEPLTKPQLEEILAFTPADISKEQEQARARAQEARQELDYLQKIERGEAEVPTTLKDIITQQIKAKNPEQVIASYDDLSRKINIQSQQKTEITEEQERYKAVAEQIELLEKASMEMPAIIYAPADSLQVYLPVAIRGVKTGFLEDLTKEMGDRFGAGAQPLEHKFVAYRLAKNTPVSRPLVDKMIEEVPFTLRAAGVNKIIPYRIE